MRCILGPLSGLPGFEQAVAGQVNLKAMLLPGCGYYTSVVQRVGPTPRI